MPDGANSLSVAPTTVSVMPRLSLEDLRLSTLRRQFPALESTDAEGVLTLFSRLGPIQSQVPRAPFLFAASRLPGTSRQLIRELFETHRLVKGSTLRGTVHTTVAEHHAWTAAAARELRLNQLGRLPLGRATPEDVLTEISRFASGGWRARADLVQHGHSWLASQGAPSRSDREPFADSLIWGNPELIRRPPDQRWETRTDTLHRLASDVIPRWAAGERAAGADDGATAPVESAAALIRTHVRAYGPVTRHDLSYFLGLRLRSVDAALARLGDQIAVETGPEGEPFLDLAVPPEGGSEDPGLRLLTEFDGLLVGYHGRWRHRLLGEDQLARVWSRVNGQYLPAVLWRGRLVATWRWVPDGARVALEVQMLAPHRPIPESEFAPAIVAAEVALGLSVSQLRVRSDS